MNRMDAELNWRDLFSKTETVGSENVEGRDCYKVVLTPKTGKPMTQYFDKQSGLMVKVVMTLKGPMGEIRRKPRRTTIGKTAIFSARTR